MQNTALKTNASPTYDTSSEGNFRNFSGSYGSPLRDDNSINELINTSVASKVLSRNNPWSETEECYGPLDHDIAQQIMNDLANNDIAKHTFGWIFILCGTHDVNTTFLLAFQAASKNFTRGFAKYHGFAKNDERSMKTLLRKQSLMIPHAQHKVQIQSVYEITPNVSLKFINKMDQETASLSHINSMSQVNLFQKIEIGKSHLLCEQLWNQIELLFIIKNEIIGVRNSSCDGTLLEPSYNYGSVKYEDLQKKVNEALTNVTVLNENFEDEKDISLEAVVKRLFTRPLVEITDQLWELLKFASSYADLKKILAFVFQISSRSSIVNIPMNNNRLGELIREISQQRLAIPHLSSTEPLELLLEIGIEKTMKDYEYIYSQSKICNLNDINIGEAKVAQKEANMNVRKSLAATAVELNRKTLLHGARNLESNDDFDGIRNSRFNEHEVEMSLAKLAQIHLVVEHILMIENNLVLDNDYKQIAKNILENPSVPFEELQTQKYDKLQIPINDKKVIQLVDNLVPNSQKIIINSENKFKTVKNVFYFNIEQIVPSLMPRENGEEVHERKPDTFHFINYSSITSKY